MNLARLPGETETEYIYRICCNKDEIGSWIDVAEVLNRELGYDYTECKYRKDFTSFQKIFDANKGKLVGDGYEKSIREQIEELRKERAKLQTEKLEYNRWLRENARDELITEKLVDAIKTLDQVDIPEHRVHTNPVGKDWLLCFGDESIKLIFLMFHTLLVQILQSESDILVFYQKLTLFLFDFHFS